MTTATAPRTDTVAVTTSRSRSRRGFARTSPTQSKKSIVLSIVMALYLLYTLVPLFWLVINATKTQPDLFTTFGLGPGNSFALFDNIAETLTYRDGIFLRWLGNTLLYVVVGAGGATLLATLAGYGLAKYNFRGRKAVFAVVLGAIAVPERPSPFRPSCSSASSASRTRPGRSSSVAHQPLRPVPHLGVRDGCHPHRAAGSGPHGRGGEFRTFFTISIRS